LGGREEEGEGSGREEEKRGKGEKEEKVRRGKCGEGEVKLGENGAMDVGG